ncbi:MAG: biotin/lipoyl-containing protein [Desulfobacterales bacterium]|jgi:biotin carboxyl carrier protein
MKYHLTINDTPYEVDIGEGEGGQLAVRVNGEPYRVVLQNPADLRGRTAQTSMSAGGSPPAAAPFKPVKAPTAPVRAAAGSGSVLAPIPGLILDIKVTVGESVVAGQSVATIEAMKMENSLTSTVSGTVKEICAQKGAQVATGDVIMIIG